MYTVFQHVPAAEFVRYHIEPPVMQHSFNYCVTTTILFAFPNETLGWGSWTHWMLDPGSIYQMEQVTFERQGVSDLSNSKDFISFLYCFYLLNSLLSLITFYLYCDLQRWNTGYIPNVINRDPTCLPSSKHGQHFSLSLLLCMPFPSPGISSPPSPKAHLPWELIQDFTHPSELFFIFLASCIFPSFEPQSTWHWLHPFVGHSFSHLTATLHRDPSKGKDYARRQSTHSIKKITNIWQALSSCRLC